MIAPILLLAACGAPPPLDVPARPAELPARAPWAETAGYAPVPQGDGWLAASPALDLRADIGPGGVVLRGAHYTSTGVGVSIAGVGSEPAPPPGPPVLGPCLTTPDDAGRCVRRVDQRRGPGLGEWWENRPDGLVHGVVLDAAGGGPLTVRFAVSGGTVDVGAGEARLVRPHGRPVRVTGVVAWDAAGEALPARLEGEGAELRLVVDGARSAVAAEMLFSPGIWSIASGSADIGSADVNGDGMGDLVVGPRVHHGSAAGLATAPAWTTDSGGGSAGRAGDVNGDGFGDVAIGSASGDGRLYVFPGSPAGLGRKPLWTSDSNDAGLATAAGDVDGDGYDDLLAAFHAPLRASVYLGSSAGLAPEPAWSIPAEHMGISVAPAGDTNADGYADVLVGNPGAAGGRGRAMLFLGGPRGLSEGAAWSLEGDRADAGFGGTVAGAGDVNRDGYADVLVSASGGTGPGAYLYLGSPAGPAATPAWTALPGTPAPESSRQVAPAGDANGDGFDDVLVCASGPGAPGRAHLYLGSAAGLAPEPAWTVTEPGAVACGPAGDVEGDTHDDWFVASGGRVTVHQLPWRRPMK